MSGEEITCPITLEPVVSPAGFTVAVVGGTPYNLAAITEWLLTHNTDPASGVILSDMRVISFPFDTYAELAAEHVARRERAVRVRRSEDARPVSPAMLALINAALDNLTDSARASVFWRMYSAAALAVLPAVPKALLAARECALVNMGVDVALFAGLARHSLVGVDVSADMLTASMFKHASFSGARVSGHFRCKEFGRTLWIGTRFINDTRFYSCNFRGEEVTFFGSSVEGTVVFSEDCCIEVGTTWKHAPDFEDECRKRGLLLSK